MAGIDALQISNEDNSNVEHAFILDVCEPEVTTKKDIEYTKSGIPVSTFMYFEMKIKVRSKNYMGQEGAQKLKAILRYMKSRRYFKTTYGVFASGYGDFVGSIKTELAGVGCQFSYIDGEIIMCNPEGE